MKLKDINIGEIFTIEETPSYPKLRTKTGYIDMRDRISKNCSELEWELRIMKEEEIVDRFDMTPTSIKSWVKELLND